MQRQSGDVWASKSGASIAETQKKIIDLLNLDADTFAASSMILQGDAGNFTKRPAGQRKAILAQILQLDQYETLQEKARAKASEANIALERIKVQMSALNKRLAGRDSIEGDKLLAETQLLTLGNNIQKTETMLQEAQVELADLQARINQADELAQRATVLRQELTTKTTERDRQQQRLNDAEFILNQEQAVLAAVTEHEGLRDGITALKVKKDQQNAIFEEASRLKNELTTVTTSLDKTIAEIQKLEINISDRPRLEASKTDYDTAVNRLTECQKEHEEDQRLYGVVKDCRDQLLRAEDRYLSEEKVYKQKIESLEAKTAMLADANCVNIESAQCRFLVDAVNAKGELVTTNENYNLWKVAADKEIVDLQATLKIAETKRTEYKTSVNLNPLEPHELQEKIDQLKPDVDLLAKLAAMVPLLDNLRVQRIDTETRQIDINTRLEDMRNQYRSLSDGLKELPGKEKRVTELQPLVLLKDRLPAAREAKDSATRTLENLTTELNGLTNQITTLEQEHTLLLGNADTLRQEAQDKVNGLRTTIDTYRTEQTILTAKLGGIQAKLDALEADALQYQTLLVEMAPLAKKLARWQTLTKAFGRDGIQALILENAVPELERIANDILGLMSGGKNYLRFETQKELKSRSGMAETLDIIVGDWAGERIYETYSGGEQLRIDFAIRFALAEMLARRAGARVDWLTIDEGFGSQSDEFLPMVIEAVQSVANRFGMVLVISHVKAVQEAFGERIEFHPATEEGTAAEVKVA
ncbi:DNA double-strand break repair Rad50 ATPase [Sporomusa ovata]|uniref:Nuclease SbcCD subunit C n=1 Tax=Sporomusa ovata TaxID=2378 RepID=A0A0U1L357_9FIRM|nr:DNA double-strand break repair Rad50 ATPase [Sporomusa ovata]